MMTGALWFGSGLVDVALNTAIVAICHRIRARWSGEGLVDEYGWPFTIALCGTVCMVLGPIGLGMTVAKLPRFVPYALARERHWRDWERDFDDDEDETE